MTTYISVGSIVAHSDLSSTDINNIFTNINKYFNGTNTWDAFILGSLTISGNLTSTTLTVSSSITLNSLTASRVLQASSGKQIESSSVTNTELGYVSGVTSSIQTQLNGKVGSTGANTITTLGTITTGVWNATTIGVGYGGTGTNTTFTTGSVIFAGGSGVYSQNNSKLFWDNINNYLGVNIGSPSYPLHVNGQIYTSGRLTAGEVYSGDGVNDCLYRLAGPNNWDLFLKVSTDIVSFRRNSTDVISITSAGDLYSISLTDYSATSTVTGWSSTTTKIINYKKIGKLCYVEFYIAGTSNATTTSFTLPSTIYPSSESFCLVHCIDNGTSSIGFGLLSTGGQFNFSISNSYSLNTWTNSGSKTIRGFIVYNL